MAARPKVMFLLFEGLAATVVESQVLANVRLLQAKGVADFEVWTFACLDALMSSSRHRREPAEQFAQAPVRLFRALRPLTFLAYAANVLLLAWHLFPRRREFSHIHARTDYSAAVAGPVARLFGLTLIWDCRGDSAAEVEERFVGRGGLFGLLVRLRLWEIRAYARLAGRLCHGALFVTDELRGVHQMLIGGKPAEVVPCAAHEELFFFDPGLRAETRIRLGYAERQTVYVYSGSLTEYQCFSNTVALFAATYRGDPCSRLLVLTPSVDQARAALAGLPEGIYQVLACTLAQVNAYLNAADVGFLLRQPLRTNFVAFPTKFAEYGLAGLAIAINENVPAAYHLAREAGILTVVCDGVLQVPRFERAQAARYFRKRLGRSTFVDAYRRIYTEGWAPEAADAP